MQTYQPSLLPQPTLAELKTKKAKLALLREKLLTDDRWAIRGLLAIYEFQTPLEKRNERTMVHNEAGFSAFDAPVLTALAQQTLHGLPLTPRQLKLLRPRISRYAAQLLAIALQKQTSETR